MILKTNPNKNIYGKYFLATEAPDDEETAVTEDQPKPRRNVKVVSVKPSNRGKDFTQVGNDPITADNTEVDDSIDIDNTDYTVDDTPEEQPESETDVQTEPTVETDDTDDNTTDTDAPDVGENDDTDFTSTDDTVESDETGEEGPDVGGDEDFTSTADDTSTDNTSTDTNTDTSTDNKITPPGVEFDSTRKYNLYKEFMSLYNATDNYISKLENVLRNDYEENQIIRISVTNLREIKDILFDYMTIRFQLNSYVQSLLFYQKMVVSVQLVFKLLKSINSNQKK